MGGMAEVISSFQTSAAKLRADLESGYQSRVSAPLPLLKAELAAARTVSWIPDFAMVLPHHAVRNDGGKMASQNKMVTRP